MAIAGDRAENESGWQHAPATSHEPERMARQLAEMLARIVSDSDEARILTKRAGFPPALLPAFNTSDNFWKSVVERAIDGVIPLEALIATVGRAYPHNRELRAISKKIAETEVIGNAAVLGPIRQLASRERQRDRMILLLAILSTATTLLSIYTLTSAESISYITYVSAMAAVVALAAYLSRSSAPVLRRIATTLIDATQASRKLETGPSLRTHRSIHQLFGDRERLFPVMGQGVDLALDAADLPEGLLPYLELLGRNGTKARVLLLDPDSPLVSRHRFSVTERADVAQSATESIREKMRKAVVLTKKCANVRLYDAMPPGNLIIVGDRIFWGGIPSVPTDVPLPVVEMTADVNGDLFWSYRRNFDRLWDSARPAAAPEQATRVAISDAVVHAHAET